jgi:hypothetical protein
MTEEMKAAAWDGLKDAVYDTSNCLSVSSQARRMAHEFIGVIAEIEVKTERAFATRPQGQGEKK